MKKLGEFFYYLKFYFQPKHRDVSQLAIASAREYFGSMRTAGNPYPRVADYDRRRIEFQAYQRGFINAYRHAYAKTHLDKLKGF